MKVLHIASTTVGGACTSAIRIHQSLLKAGINSHFLSQENPLEFSDNIHVFQYHFSLLKRILLKVGVLKSYLNETEKLMNSINRNAEVISLPFSELDITLHPQYKEADIIHLHWVSGILDYKSFFDKNSKPVIWTMHDMQPFMGIFHYTMDLYRNKSLEKKEKEVLMNKEILLKGKDITIHNTSEWMIERSGKSKLFKNKKQYLIPYPIDTSVYKPIDKKASKLVLNLPTDKLCIGFISLKINNPRKGFDIMLKSAKNIYNNNIHWFCIGSSNGIVDIPTLGKVNDQELLITIYNAADVIIIPSIEEAFSNVFIESISCGTPVIAFNTGAMADHVLKGNLGVIANEISEKGLSEAVIKFIETKSLFDREKIRNYAIENFEMNNVASSFIHIYEEVLTRNGIQYES